MKSPGKGLRIDHVQLAMPKGSEDRARSFYRDALGMKEIPKPKPLAERGGCWFGSGEAQLHLGVEEDFRPAKKAHPALLVEGLDEILARCEPSLHQRRMQRLADAAVCTSSTLLGIGWNSSKRKAEAKSHVFLL